MCKTLSIKLWHIANLPSEMLESMWGERMCILDSTIYGIPLQEHSVHVNKHFLNVAQTFFKFFIWNKPVTKQIKYNYMISLLYDTPILYDFT